MPTILLESEKKRENRRRTHQEGKSIFTLQRAKYHDEKGG
jgi:hypothetical protein